MKTIIISLFGFLSALFFSYKKGASNQKQKIENEQTTNTLGTVKEKQEIDTYVDNLSDDELNKLLLKPRNK